MARFLQPIVLILSEIPRNLYLQKDTVLPLIFQLDKVDTYVLHVLTCRVVLTFISLVANFGIIHKVLVLNTGWYIS